MNIKKRILSLMSALDPDLMIALFSIKQRDAENGNRSKIQELLYQNDSIKLLHFVIGETADTEPSILEIRPLRDWEKYFSFNRNIIFNFVSELTELSNEEAQDVLSVFVQTYKNIYPLPHHIASLLLSPIQKQNASVYYASDASGSLLQNSLSLLKKHNITVFGQYSSWKQLNKTREMLNHEGVSADLGEFPASSLSNDLFKEKKFDYAIANPPFNSSAWYSDALLHNDPRWSYGIPPQSNANFAWLQHTVFHLNKTGKAAIILPNSTLTSALSAEKRIRAKIIDSGALDAIITFPQGIFKTANTAFCIWFIDQEKAPERPTLILDASRLTWSKKTEEACLKSAEQYMTDFKNGILKGKNEFYAVVDTAEIASKGYLLNPNLYLKSNFHIRAEENTPALRALTEAVISEGVSERLTSSLQEYLYKDHVTIWHNAPLLDMYWPYVGASNNSTDSPKTAIPCLKAGTVIRNAFVPDDITDTRDILEEQKHIYDKMLREYAELCEY